MHEPPPSCFLIKHCPKCLSCSSISVLGNFPQYGHWKFFKCQWFSSEAMFFFSFLGSSLDWEAIWKIRPPNRVPMLLSDPLKKEEALRINDLQTEGSCPRRTLLREALEEVERPMQQMWRKHKRVEALISGETGQWTSGQIYQPTLLGAKDAEERIYPRFNIHWNTTSWTQHRCCVLVRFICFLWMWESSFFELSPLFVTHSIFWTMFLLLVQLQVLSVLPMGPQRGHSYEGSVVFKELENEAWESAFLMPGYRFAVVVVVVLVEDKYLFLYH